MELVYVNLVLLVRNVKVLAALVTTGHTAIIPVLVHHRDPLAVTLLLGYVSAVQVGREDHVTFRVGKDHGA